MTRDEIIRDLQERANGAGKGQYMTLRCDVAREIIVLLKEQETNKNTKGETKMELNKNQKYIIRCDRAGVFFANVEEWDAANATAKLMDCRRLWYWDGAASLSQMAMEGVSKPRNCKFTVTVPELIVGGVIEIIPCTEIAAKRIAEVSEWKV